MKKISLTAFAIFLCMPLLTNAQNNWYNQFDQQELVDYFGYDNSFNADYDNGYSYTDFDRDNRSVEILSKKSTAHDLILKIKNLELRRDERYSLSCRDYTAPAYDSVNFKNYDDLSNYNRNRTRTLKLNNLDANTKYNCIISIEEEYKKNRWRLIGLKTNFSFTTKSSSYSYDLSTEEGRRLSYENSSKSGNNNELNDPSRIDTSDTSNIIAYRYVPAKSTRKMNLFGPRYYQYLVLKSLRQ